MCKHDNHLHEHYNDDFFSDYREEHSSSNISYIDREYDDNGEWIMPSPYLEDYANNEEYISSLLDRD